MRKITTIAGTSILVWLFFSPVIAIYLFSKTYPDSTGLYLLIYILLTYLVLGILGYFIVKNTGGVFMEHYEPSEWGVTVSYTILTSMLYNVGVSIVLGILSKTSFSSLSIIVSPFIFWFALMFVANSIKPVPEGVVKKSIYLFVIVNLLFAFVFKFLMNQTYLSVADLTLIINLIVFYFGTKKYLTTVENVKQSLEI